MKIRIKDNKEKNIKADLEIIFVVAGDLSSVRTEDKKALDRTGFAGKTDELELLPESGRL